ncbi:hypothetical protein F5887DRAFT_923077 [Amanita rubescens]|nr:hypothetical protein F5887DRAFT_923077 [Amanita rubescens]
MYEVDRPAALFASKRLPILDIPSGYVKIGIGYMCIASILKHICCTLEQSEEAMRLIGNSISVPVMMPDLRYERHPSSHVADRKVIPATYGCTGRPYELRAALLDVALSVGNAESRAMRLRSLNPKSRTQYLSLLREERMSLKGSTYVGAQSTSVSNAGTINTTRELLSQED